MRVLDAAQTAEVLPFAALIAALRVAVVEYAQGLIQCPERQVVPLAGSGTLLSMPVAAHDLAAHKLVNVCPGNRERGLPTIQGQVTAFDGLTGAPLFTLDAPTVTARRTAGITLLGVGALHGPPRQVVLIGTGRQAQGHVEALQAVYPQAQVLVMGSTLAKAQVFAEQFGVQATDGIPDGADVVVTVTGSHWPVYDLPARAGRLLVGVGAFTPEMAEYAPGTVQGSRVFVDDPAGARHEAGDLLQAGVNWLEVNPLADALRDGQDSATGDLRGVPALLKTVGCAAWDLAACRVARAHLAVSN